MRCGAVDGEADELVGVVVELALVAARQQLRVARHHAQRLLQVVRGDVGELLELGVRARQLVLLGAQRRLGAKQRLLGALALGDVAGGGEDADDGAGLVAVDGRVVEHVGDLARGVADGERVVETRPSLEDLLVAGARLIGIREVVAEVGADELLARRRP